MLKICRGVLIVVSAIAFTGIASAANKMPISYMFVMDSNNSQVVKDDSGWKLVLHLNKDKVAYFSDRPNRVTGKITAEKFVTLWNKGGKDGFAKDAPNAVLVGTEKKDGSDFNRFIELSNPSYDVKTNTFSFNIKRLDNKIPDLHDLKDTTLIIDDYTTSFLSGMLD